MNQQTNRRHFRVPLNLLVQVRAKDYGDLVERRALNISNGGVFIETERPHREGVMVFFQLATREDGALIEAMGRVVRTVGVEEAKEPMRPGMGIEFVSMTEQSEARLHQLVHQRRQMCSPGGKMLV